jgi:hypothetical protein
MPEHASSFSTLTGVEGCADILARQLVQDFACNRMPGSGEDFAAICNLGLDESFVRESEECALRDSERVTCR